MEVQIFGVRNHPDVRRAERFFKERRIRIHFVDFRERGPARGELRRFFDRFGEESLIDRDSPRFTALGLLTAHYGKERWLDIAIEEPLVLRLPLVRSGSRLSVGAAEAEWKEWVSGG